MAMTLIGSGVFHQVWHGRDWAAGKIRGWESRNRTTKGLFMAGNLGSGAFCIVFPTINNLSDTVCFEVHLEPQVRAPSQNSSFNCMPVFKWGHGEIENIYTEVTLWCQPIRGFWSHAKLQVQGQDR